MSYRQIPANATNQIVHVSIPGTNNLAHDADGLSAGFDRPGSGSYQAIELVEHSTEGGHVGGGWVPIFPGEYRLYLPDAVVAEGASHVRVIVHYQSHTETVDIELT
jgi:hypothetical protein